MAYPDPHIYDADNGPADPPDDIIGDALERAQGTLIDALGEWHSVQEPHLPEHLAPIADALQDVELALREWEGWRNVLT